MPTHRYRARQWRSAAWRWCAGPCWCAARSSWRAGHRCAWPGHSWRSPLAAQTCSSRRSQTWWRACDGKASAASGCAPLPASRRNCSSAHPRSGGNEKQSSRLVSLQNGSFNTEFPDQCKKLTAFRNYLGKYRVSLWLIGNRKAMSTHPVALVFTDMDETAHMELWTVVHPMALLCSG